jgi:glyoxylase-like metal-dependent hydrolase (beta-lactamase superfamily II)
MDMSKILRTLAPTAMLPLLVSPSLLPAQEPPTRAIERIAGGLYRFQNAFHYSVFLVTRQGIIATDPINVEAALWLKGELTRRFGEPVRYLIYSHGHPDHISGGEVFADTAVVIAHENAKAEIMRAGVPTAVPQFTFTDRLTIELGGKSVELSYLGRNHSDSSIVMRFPDERAVFAVDFVAVERLPYRDFPESFLDEWPQSLRALEAMDFEILAPGHGRMGTKGDVRSARQYLEDLRSEVAVRLGQGMSEAEIVKAVTLDKYRNWERYEDWRALNVQGMVRHLRQSR